MRGWLRKLWPRHQGAEDRPGLPEDERTFSARFEASVRAPVGTLDVTGEGELRLKITPPGGEPVIVFLNNAYEQFRADPAALDKIIDGYVNAVLESLHLGDQALDPANVVPVIKDRGWLDVAASSAEAHPGVGEPHSVQPLSGASSRNFAIETSAVRWLCLEHGAPVQARLEALLAGYEAHRPLPFSTPTTLTALVRFISLAVSVWVLHRCHIGHGDESLLALAERHFDEQIDRVELDLGGRP